MNASTLPTPSAPPPVPFPFAALVGQPLLSQALLLAAVEPALGGVLIEGPRGTAKSTAARALAQLMPGAPFVTLPLGASLEHLVGTLDLGQALAGHELRFAPGLLARAHGGVLYVDEVNLLPDGLVDALLDAAASGVNLVERDGISHRHAARFVLVGTMNPEEGSLRPQLQDRFGLCVRLGNLQDAATRQAAVAARLAFDADPEGFLAAHAPEQARLASRLAEARARLGRPGELPWPAQVHAEVTLRCLQARVDGVRADLVMLRAARALAAWEGAPAIGADHVARVAPLVLAHRARDADGQPLAGMPSAGSPSEAPTYAPADVPAGTQAPERGGAAPDDDPWGALPPEPVGLTRVKPLRPLAGAERPKKA